MYRRNLVIVLSLALGFCATISLSLRSAIQAQPRSGPRHVITERPHVEVETAITTDGGERIITYRVTPRKVHDMEDFHIKTFVGNKIGAVSQAAPFGWTSKANKSTKGFSWGTGDSSTARPLPEGQTSTFSLRMTHSNAEITPHGSWYATRNGKTKLPTLIPRTARPRKGTVYPGTGAQGPLEAKRRKKRPVIDYGPQPMEPTLPVPYVTLAIPEYSLGESDEDSVGLAAGSAWTASAACTSSDTIFTVLLSLDPEFTAFREARFLQESGNDAPGTAMVHFFEGNRLDESGRCGFTLFVDDEAVVGHEFYALVLADDDHDGTLDLSLDIESDVYAFRVE